MGESFLPIALHHCLRPVICTCSCADLLEPPWRIEEHIAFRHPPNRFGQGLSSCAARPCPPAVISVFWSRAARATHNHNSQHGPTSKVVPELESSGLGQLFQ